MDFEWISGHKVSFLNWYHTEPNHLAKEHCSTLQSIQDQDKGKWWNTHCKMKFSFACKIDLKHKKSQPKPDYYYDDYYTYYTYRYGR